MAQRQVFVRPLLQFELRKGIFEPGIEALIVGNDYDQVSFGIQQLLASPDHRKRVVDMFQDVKQRDDVILPGTYRSEEHTSELQSRVDLVCRLLLEKKKNKHKIQ